MSELPARSAEGGPTVSVVVTNFNYGMFVTEAVSSALGQTHRPLEVVVVDDGSTDDSRERLAAAFGAQPIVRLAFGPNQGQLAAFARGFAESSGDLVAFLDADDAWKPDHLARVVEIFRARPHVDFVFTNYERVGEASGYGLPATRDTQVGVRVLETHFAQTWTGSPTSALALRRPLCAKLLALPRAEWPEWKTRADDCLVVGAGVLGACKYYLATPTVKYRVHGANHWYGREKGISSALQHGWKVRRLMQHYAPPVDVRALPSLAALMEFQTIEHPTLSELGFYSRLIGHSPASLFVRLRQRAAMFKHYVRRITGR